MVTRRQAREWALQLLVQFDLNMPGSVEQEIENFWQQQRELEAEAQEEVGRVPRLVFGSPSPDDQATLAEMVAFAEERMKGVWAERELLDAEITPFLKNWSVYRLGTIERNVLRLGVWELKHCAEIPTPIVVNEAIDLAKFFSETKSGRFVNAVMDNLAKKLRAPQPEVFNP